MSLFKMVTVGLFGSASAVSKSDVRSALSNAVRRATPIKRTSDVETHRSMAEASNCVWEDGVCDVDTDWALGLFPAGPFATSVTQQISCEKKKTEVVCTANDACKWTPEGCQSNSFSLFGDLVNLTAFSNCGVFGQTLGTMFECEGYDDTECSSAPLCTLVTEYEVNEVDGVCEEFTQCSSVDLFEMYDFTDLICGMNVTSCKALEMFAGAGKYDCGTNNDETTCGNTDGWCRWKDGACERTPTTAPAFSATIPASCAIPLDVFFACNSETNSTEDCEYLNNMAGNDITCSLAESAYCDDDTKVTKMECSPQEDSFFEILEPIMDPVLAPKMEMVFDMEKACGLLDETGCVASAAAALLPGVVFVAVLGLSSI